MKSLRRDRGLILSAIEDIVVAQDLLKAES